MTRHVFSQTAKEDFMKKLLIFAALIAVLPEPDAAADRVREWFLRQFERLGEEGA